MNNKNCLRCQQLLNVRLSWQNLWKFERIKSSYICSSCINKFQHTSNIDTCRYCQHPLDEQKHCCDDCHHWLLLYGEKVLDHYAIYIYNEAFKEWITDYKYRLDVRQAQVMVEVLNLIYQQYNNYLWTLLPSSPKNYKKRGFNPMEYLLECADIPFIKIFDYVGDNLSQAQKTKRERMQLKQPFALKNHTDIKGKEILIIDDVYTTGSTLINAKVAILKAGAKSCKSITLARDIMK